MTPVTSPVNPPENVVKEKIEEFDDLLDFIGASGKYQKRMLYGVIVPISFISALLSYSRIFTLYVPDHFCSPANELEGPMLEEWKIKNIPMESLLGETEQYSSCKMYNWTDIHDTNLTAPTMDCQYGWVFSTTDFDSTIATDNLWVCDKSLYPTNVFTISEIGSLVGHIVFGPLADKYGRRPMFFISLALNLIFAMVTFFVTHIYELYVSLSFIYSLGFSMIATIPPLVMAETCSSEYRAWTFTVNWIAWVGGMATIPAIAYLSRTWFILAMSATTPAFLLFLLWPLLSESPRWLLSVGRVAEASKIIRHITKINGTKDKISDEELRHILKKLAEVEQANKGKLLGFWTLFSSRRLAMITILMSVTWTASFMIYEILTLNTPYMSGNQFLNFFLLAIVELPGSILGGYLIETLGRRWTPVIFGTLLAILCVVAGASPQDLTVLIITCILLAKFVLTVTIYVAYVQATELFPTPLRATGNAVCSTSSSFLGLLNPSIVYTANFYSGAPYLVMALIASIGAFLSAFLPETLKQHLPETVEDANDFGRGNKFWSLRPDYDRKRRKSTRAASLSAQGLPPSTVLPAMDDSTINR